MEDARGTSRERAEDGPKDPKDPPDPKERRPPRGTPVHRELLPLEEGESKAKELATALARHRGERHVIVVQSFPDPDAISSAMAHQRISQLFDIDAEIAYDGVISHHENIALVQLLNIPLVRIREDDDLSRYDGSVFIDTPGTTTGLTARLAKAGIPIVAIVDHHEPQGLIDAEFDDIRLGASATATIYTEYLEQGLLELDRAEPEDVRLATALMHGIRSETNALIRAGRPEFLAISYLVQFVDQATLETILAIQRTRNSMDVIKSALENREVVDNFSIAGVGYVRYEDRDAIPQAADFLMTEENVHTAIVFGIVARADREAVVGSLRTKKATLSPDTILKEALGGHEPGRYYGGGRREAGGFEIPIGFLAGALEEDFARWKWRLYDEQIKRKLWSRLGVHDHLIASAREAAEDGHGED